MLIFFKSINEFLSLYLHNRKRHIAIDSFNEHWSLQSMISLPVPQMKSPNPQLSWSGALPFAMLLAYSSDRRHRRHLKNASSKQLHHIYNSRKYAGHIYLPWQWMVRRDFAMTTTLDGWADRRWWLWCCACASLWWFVFYYQQFCKVKNRVKDIGYIHTKYTIDISMAECLLQAMQSRKRHINMDSNCWISIDWNSYISGHSSVWYAN